MFLGTHNVVRLVYVEVIPLVMSQVAKEEADERQPRLSCAMVKHYLQTLSLRSSLSWKGGKGATSNHSNYATRVVLEWIDRNLEQSILEEDEKMVTTSGHDTFSRLTPGYLRLEETSTQAYDDDDTGPENNNNSSDVHSVAQKSTNESKIHQVPIFHLPSEDPTQLQPIPCCIKAYSDCRPRDLHLPNRRVEALVTSATLVRIFPLQAAHPVVDLGLSSDLRTKEAPIENPKLDSSNSSWYAKECFLQGLAGESSRYKLPESLQTEVLGNHNPETIKALTLRMLLLLSQPIYVGTTADASTLRQTQQTRSTAVRRAIGNFYQRRQKSTRPTQDGTICEKVCFDQTFSFQSGRNGGAGVSAAGMMQWEPSLIVHSSNHAAGKTLLVQAIAASKLLPHDPLIHVIPASSILAKFGIHADAALESLLHGIIVSAAVSARRSICIILDQLDVIVPPNLSGRSSSGDSAVPVLNATASLLKNLTRSLQRRREMPFPAKNPLYNVSGTNGRVLSVRLCLVATVTCPDDGWRASSGDSTGGGSSVFDAMVGGRYRLESLTATTRLAAFRRAFERHHLKLDNEADDQLPLLCASASWVQGSSFEHVARRLRALLVKQGNLELIASVGDFELVLRAVRGGNMIPSAQVRFQGTSGLEQSDSTSVKQQGIQERDSFLGAVGGNTEAKLSLEDALALDPTRRQILAKFGLSPPTGILLYGPPGVGKTLLAKAVAQLLNTKEANRTSGHPSSLGGAFISLRSSDIVRAEIGTSEKIVVSAFELARKNAPSVIFIDEFQALFTERSSGGSGRLASTLLQCMDDIKRWRDLDNSANTGGSGSEEIPDQVYDKGNHVVVMGATNTPWLVDVAFVRPGRFDRVVFVGLPTVLERQSILLVHIKQMRLSSRLDANSVDVLCQIMAGRTQGFSGADLAALCRAAAIRCLNDCGEEGDIEQGHFELALEYDVKPSSSHELVLRLQEWRPR